MDKDEFIDWFSSMYPELAERFLKERGLEEEFNEWAMREYIERDPYYD